MEIQRKWQGEVQGARAVELKFVPTTEQISDEITELLHERVLNGFGEDLILSEVTASEPWGVTKALYPMGVAVVWQTTG